MFISYFKQTKIASFQRQLNMYGFKRLTKGPDKGGYYHRFFMRKNPELACNIDRTKTKGRKVPKSTTGEMEPNFYVSSSCSQNRDEITESQSRVTLHEEEKKGALSTSTILNYGRDQPPSPLMQTIFEQPMQLSSRGGTALLHGSPASAIDFSIASNPKMREIMLRRSDRSLALSLKQQLQRKQLQQQQQAQSALFPYSIGNCLLNIPTPANLSALSTNLLLGMPVQGSSYELNHEWIRHVALHSCK